MAKSVIDQLIQFGNVRRGLFGVVIGDVTAETAKALGLSVTRGALVGIVTEGSSADNTGVEAGDVITSVNGKEIDGASDFRNFVALMRIGEEFEFTILRGEDTLQKEATIGENDPFQSSDTQVLDGVSFENIPRSHPLFGHISGVVIAELEETSHAYVVGLRQHDLIVRINRHQIRSLRDLRSIDFSSRPIYVRFIRDSRSYLVELR